MLAVDCASDMLAGWPGGGVSDLQVMTQLGQLRHAIQVNNWSDLNLTSGQLVFVQRWAKFTTFALIVSAFVTDALASPT